MHFLLVSDRSTKLLDARVIQGHPGSSGVIRGHMCLAGISWAYVYVASLCQANLTVRLKELEASMRREKPFVHEKVQRKRIRITLT